MPITIVTSGIRRKLKKLNYQICAHNNADHNDINHHRDEEEAEEGRTKVLAARQREREETRAQVLSSLSSR